MRIAKQEDIKIGKGVWLLFLEKDDKNTFCIDMIGRKRVKMISNISSFKTKIKNLDSSYLKHILTSNEYSFNIYILDEKDKEKWRKKMLKFKILSGLE